MFLNSHSFFRKMISIDRSDDYFITAHWKQRIFSKACFVSLQRPPTIPAFDPHFCDYAIKEERHLIMGFYHYTPMSHCYGHFSPHRTGLLFARAFTSLGASETLERFIKAIDAHIEPKTFEQTHFFGTQFTAQALEQFAPFFARLQSLGYSSEDDFQKYFSVFFLVKHLCCFHEDWGIDSFSQKIKEAYGVDLTLEAITQ